MSNATVLRATQEALVEALLRSGKEVTFTISSQSMWPFLESGDRIVLVGADPRDLRAGDIVLFHSDLGWVAHRIVVRRIIEGKIVITTKGDNSVLAEGARSGEDLLGQAVAVQRGSNQVTLQNLSSRWAATWVGLLSAVEWSCFRMKPGLTRAIALKGLRISVHASGLIARRMMAFSSIRQADGMASPPGE